MASNGVEKKEISDGVVREVKELTELEKYWKAVKDNPNDFTGWTYLLQYVEQENDLKSAVEAFDAFLTKYPYCYGYWKKFADFQKRHDNMETAEQIFERGLKAIPLSIDLWNHYIAFTTARYENSDDKDTRVRELYDRAIVAAGSDFRSDKLWEAYINWEVNQKQLKNITALYDRLLAIPTQLYKHHFEKFGEFVKVHDPKEILSEEEFKKHHEEPATDETTGAGDAPKELTDEEKTKIREKIVEARKGVHKTTEEEVSKRWSFEEGIRRPYFHVKPLEKGQLKNWSDYLDYEVANGTHDRALVLFERAMIACALYEEFWLKYAKYIEKFSIEATRNVFHRACTVHLQTKTDLHMAWCAFEERQGEHEKAVAALEHLSEKVPDLASVTLKRISLERRRGNQAEVERLYQEYIDKAEDSDTKTFYRIKYARYLSKVVRDPTKAKEVLRQGFDKEKGNTKLLVQLIDTEYQGDCSEDTLTELFDLGITNEVMSLEERLLFSQRRLDYLEDFGNDVQKLKQCYDAHQELYGEASRKKRKAEESGQSTDKKAKTDANGYNDYYNQYYNQGGYGNYDYSSYYNYGSYNYGSAQSS